MSHPPIRAAFAGVEAGVLGGLVMLAALGTSSILEHDQWWSYPNLLGATFYGSRAFRGGPGWATVSGIALQLLLAGFAGAWFAVIFGNAHTLLRTVLGVAWGALLFYASREMYRQLAPLVALYAPDTSMLLGHMLMGVFFARARSTAKAGASPPEEAVELQGKRTGSQDEAGEPASPVGNVPARASDRDSSSISG